MAAQTEEEDKTTGPRKEGERDEESAASSVLIRGERTEQQEGCVALGTLPLAEPKWECWASCPHGSDGISGPATRAEGVLSHGSDPAAYLPGQGRRSRRRQ